MPRGPLVTQKEINQAHELRSQGKKLREIQEVMKRTQPTIRKMLKLPRNPYEPVS